ncbi:OmpA family protein, partial [Rhodoblastus sp.]|uniref:OmpA family protein n=1 Tax=Rhodoblastus sp. TaxID=1962975 RepID=UPI003F947043
HKEAVLSVEGHADASGPEAYTVLLSSKRAEKVAAWLAQFGAPAAQIATRAAGVSPPVHWTTEMQSNRQVILQIEGVEACRDDSAPARQP